jgi:hypothetical protein
MQKIILFFSGILFLVTLQAQSYTYTYTYDGSGNRTKRTYILVAVKSAVGRDTQSNVNPPEKLTEQLDEYTITIFPNPTSGELILQILPENEEFKGKISVFGLDGRLIISLQDLVNINIIDLTSLNPGNYILRLNIGNSEKTYNIIKE